MASGILSDEAVQRLSIHPIERQTILASIGAPSDAEIIAFRRGAFAYRRGEAGTLECSDRIYPTDMCCRVAWRTGWMVTERAAKGGA